MDKMDWLETSPTPWNAGDKHAILYDANDKGIAVFGEGGKGMHDLNNRNRAATCVNALVGVSDPHGFVRIAKKVALGELPLEVLHAVLTGAEEFQVVGINKAKKVVAHDPFAYTRARWVANMFRQSGGTEVEIIHGATETVIPRG